MAVVCPIGFDIQGLKNEVRRPTQRLRPIRRGPSIVSCDPGDGCSFADIIIGTELSAARNNIELWAG
jgi:hypothetical protein